MSTSVYQVPSWEPGAESKSDQAVSPPTSCADGGGGLLLQKYKTNGCSHKQKWVHTLVFEKIYKQYKQKSEQ